MESGGNYAESYSYDPTTGNLSSKTGMGSYGYNDAAHKHAVTHLDGIQRYWYDANGNQTRRVIGNDTYDLAYDAENRLVEVRKNATVIAAFSFDGDGRRVKGTVASTTTVYVGSYFEYSSGAITLYYYAGAQRLAQRQGGALTWIVGDHLGSSSVTVDANGGNPVTAVVHCLGDGALEQREFADQVYLYRAVQAMLK